MALKVFSRNLTNKQIVPAFIKYMSSSSDCKNVGFVGLGNMGGHMSSNLIKHGHKLHVFDISKEASENLKKKGATVYDNTADLALNSDFVITMLPNNDIVYNTYRDMIKKGVNKDTFFIDSSTIDPNVVKNIQKIICEEGARFVDAPVSGGVVGAEQATLTFMVGSTEEEYNCVKDILECMGKRITHCGTYGMGQAAKLCNNMMLGISMCGVSETMNLAIRLGLDPKVFLGILNSSTGRCWASEINNPVPGLIPNAPASRQYSGGFLTDLMTKDLELASGVAIHSNSPIPMGALAHNIFRLVKSKGLGRKDFSVVYDFIKNEK